MGMARVSNGRGMSDAEWAAFDIEALRRDPQEPLTAKAPRKHAKGLYLKAVPWGWVERALSSKSTSTIKVAFVLLRQSGIKRGGWVMLPRGEPCLRDLSSSARSRAFIWLREAGLIETRQEPGFRMEAWVRPWKPEDG